MLRTIEIIIAYSEINDFENFIKTFKVVANASSERFLKIDIKPDYGNTPENWEDRVEAVFY